MRSLSLELYKKTLGIKPLQHEVLIGLLLGDGHVEQPYMTPRARLKIEQREKMKAYVQWLHKIFQGWTSGKIRIMNKTLKTTCKSYKHYGFTTFSHEAFMPYRQMFYYNKRKIIPNDIYDLLTPTSIAVWFMDDGSVKSHQSKGRILNTHSFTEQEVIILCDVLQRKFSLNSWPRKQRDGVQIYISGRSATTLQKIVEPYMIQEMKYKLPWYGHSR